MLDKKVYSLSGGEQQRLALARLLLKNSKVILCDEPSAALDKENTQIVINILKEQAQSGKVVIVSSHDEYIINQCDECLSLDA
jgi:putative ABC transport system ATP-binding protein